MTSNTAINLIDLAQHGPEVAGHKAHNLSLLAAKGFPVTDGVVLPAPWVEAASEAELRSALESVFNRLASSLAVRSSAVAEDTGDQSFAGQYETVLSVDTLDGLVDAVKTVRDSGSSERVRRYGGETSAIGVLVQRMVPAEAAGVAFTATRDG